MGWLRHSALKVTPIRTGSAGPFDEIPVDDLVLDRELEQWKRWANRPAALGQQILALASQEMQARASMPRRRGKPASLLSYKEYKRLFLQEWARHITAAAKQHGIAHEELAHILGEKENGTCRVNGWIGGNWRELLRGQGQRRIAWELFIEMDKVARARKWNALRRGNMVTIWTKRLIASQEFEQMALQFSPQFHHTEKAKIS